MFLIPNVNAGSCEAYRDRRAVSLPAVVRAVHDVGMADGVYVIIILFLLDGVLVATRSHVIPFRGYDFIWVNLILAAVPYLLSLCADVVFRVVPRRTRRIRFLRLLLLPLFAVWLLFLPNAPYVLTDFRHLEYWTNRQLLYDTMMMGTYAVTGYALGVISLVIMQRIVFASFGGRVSRIFVIICCFLAGIGVHLGRTLRYNSWDVFSQAETVLGTVLDRLAHLYSHPLTLFDGLSYGALLLIGYGAIVTLASEETRAGLFSFRGHSQGQHT